MNRIHIVSQWGQGRLCAYLYGFDIDKYALQAEHESFLRATVADALKGWIGRKSRTDFCCVWLLGTASRSGTWAHNSPLASNRAKEVKTFLERSLRKSALPKTIVDGGLSESVAFLSGKRDGREHPFDRSVLLVAQWVSLPNPPPPIIKRPDVEFPPGVYKYFLVRSRWASSDSLPADKKGRVTISNLTMEIDIMDVHRGEVATYTFDGVGPGVDLTPPKLQPPDRPMVGIVGPWHKFKIVNGNGFQTRNCDDFAGNTLFEEYSLLKWSWSGLYFDPDKKFFGKYHVAVRDFDTGIPSGWTVASGNAWNGKMTLKQGRRPVKKDQGSRGPLLLD
jgi:hypothetical protein